MTETQEVLGLRAKALLPLTHVVYHVLLSLTGGDKHGYAIIKDVSTRTEGQVEIEAGTLYAAIKRMKDDGLLEETGRPRCYGHHQQ